MGCLTPPLHQTEYPAGTDSLRNLPTGTGFYERSADGGNEATFGDQGEYDQGEYDQGEYDKTVYDQTRSTLSDQFPNDGLTIPEPYTREVPGVIVEDADPFAGFRVQILSTRQVLEADSVKDQFRVLSDSLFAGYQPVAYIRYRSPYYRVRVGDFSTRERAITLSGLLKPWYPDAWVVYERIEPTRVPADTVAIELRLVSPP